jgi:hypothetical protein
MKSGYIVMKDVRGEISADSKKQKQEGCLLLTVNRKSNAG